MKIVFFTFYYPPDLSAGSFRSEALARELRLKIGKGDELHILTTHPNRYQSHKAKADNYEFDRNINIYRIAIPSHQNRVLSQARAFTVYFFSAYRLCNKIGPDFIIGTSSRLMTGILTWFSARRNKSKYFLDIRDIFSETISDLYYRKNRLLGKLFKLIFTVIEKAILRKAVGVNVVSEGFPSYFEKKGIDVSDWSFFPNGIDIEFEDIRLQKDNKEKSIKRILYVGNIGSGQGLENVIPEVAKKLEGKYHFVIVGDGAKQKELLKKIKEKEVINFEYVPPVKRSKLLKYYKAADILFLHLNDVDAFRRVLPSKIFEYAATKKPIVAGLSGYSAQFINRNIPHATLFDPCNINKCIEAINKAEERKIDDNDIDSFIKKFSREKIMRNMSDHIINLL